MPKQKIVSIVALILSIVVATQQTLNELNTLGILSTAGFSLLVRKRLIAIEFFALCVLYLIWLFETRRTTIARSSFVELLNPAGLFLAVAWLAYPVTNDIYLYLQYGLMSLDRVNPYFVRAVDFNSSLSNLLDWGQTSTYGVVSLFFFIISARLAEINLFLGVYGFKLICLIFHTLNGYLIWRILKANTYRNQVTLAYLISPVLLFEQVTEAHVDVFLCTILIAIDQFLKQRRYFPALLMTSVGFLTKTLPIIWLPLIGVFLIRERRWRSIARFLFVSAIALIALKFTVFPSLGAWSSLFNPGVSGKTAGSWHNLLDAVLIRSGTVLPISTQSMIRGLFNRFTLFVFAIYYAVTLGRIYLNRSITEHRLTVQIGWVTFVLFAFSTAWYQPWYATVLLPIAALNLQAPFFAIASFVFSLLSTVTYACLEYGTTATGIIAALLTMGSAIAMLILRPRIIAFIKARFLHETEGDLQQMKQ